eukprot:8650665-Heterocapsa_arctica.AAC.1
MVAFRTTFTLVVTSLIPGPRIKKSSTRCSPFSGTHVSTSPSPGAMKPPMGSVTPASAIIFGVRFQSPPASHAAPSKAAMAPNTSWSSSSLSLSWSGFPVSYPYGEKMEPCPSCAFRDGMDPSAFVEVLVLP